MDLVKLAGQAEKRPVTASFPVVQHTCGQQIQPGQQVPVPSRMTFRLNFPIRSRFVTAAALDGSSDARAEFRVGISDGRTYETLWTSSVAASDCQGGWTPIGVNLSHYAGWQWSLFYRPDERVWELILGVTIQRGRADRAIWGAPRVETDTDAARAFRERPRR